MTGPAWLAAAFAAVMIVITLYCAGRLAVARAWRRATEVDADAVHVLMGAAMAGMLLPPLNPLPARAWEAVFATAAAWFTLQATRNLSRIATADGRWCTQPIPHLVESAAMIYMFAAVPGGSGQGMSMAAMAGAGGISPALAVVLALFMTGYVLRTADQLTSRARATATVTTAAKGAAGAAADRRGRLAGSPALAPRLAACYKIAMGITMGYMLVTMF